MVVYVLIEWLCFGQFIVVLIGMGMLVIKL